jgi:HEAT repeats
MNTEIPTQTDAIVEQLHAEDPFIRLAALTHVSRQALIHDTETDPFIVDAVIDALNDKNPLIPIEAAHTLGAIGGDKAYITLSSLALTEENPQIVVNLAYVLGRFGGKDVTPVLMTLLTHHDSHIQTAAATALVHMSQKTDTGEMEGYGEVRRVAGGLFRQLNPTTRREMDAALTANPLLRHYVKILQDNPHLIRELRTHITNGVIPEDYIEKLKNAGITHKHPDEDITPTRAIAIGMDNWITPQEYWEMKVAGEMLTTLQYHGHDVDIHSLAHEIVQRTNEDFEASFNLAVSSAETTLFAFSSNIDVGCFFENSEVAQAIIDRAIEDAVAEGIVDGRTRLDVLQEIADIIKKNDDDTYVYNKAQFVAHVLKLFVYQGKNDGGGRIDIRNKDLPPWINELFAGHQTVKLGGLPAHGGNFADLVGYPAAVYTIFHSPDQALAYTSDVPFYDLKNGTIFKAKDPSKANPNHPTKYNSPIEIPKDITMSLPKDLIALLQPYIKEFTGVLRKTKPDRTICKVPYLDNKGNPIEIEPVFPKGSLETVAQHETLVLNGYHYLPDLKKLYKGTRRYERMCKKIRKQLTFLKYLHKGLTIHLEYAGSPANVDYLRDVVMGNFTSMSVNHTEIRGVVQSLRKLLGYTYDDPPPSDELTNYYYARELATVLGLNRVYIHGQDLDMTIIMTTDNKQEMIQKLRSERQAIFVGKQRVYQWLTGKPIQPTMPPEDLPSRLLKDEGFDALVRNVHAFVEQMLPNPENNEEIELEQLHRTLEISKDGFMVASPGNFSVAWGPSKEIYERLAQATSAGDTIAVSDLAARNTPVKFHFWMF